MTKTSRDVPTHEGMTIADRLKAAREAENKTRKAVYEGTGIPASTLEKYESGNMDPNTTRLQAICDFLGVSVNWVLNGDSPPSVAASKKTAETQVSAKVAETAAETFNKDAEEYTETASATNKNDPMGHVRGLLAEFDGMRATNFEGVQRGAIVLTDDILTALKRLEPRELMMMASERELHQCDSEASENILNLFNEDFDEAQKYCGNIEERILDTAIFGIDLFNLEIGHLHILSDDVPDNIKLEKPNGWVEEWSEKHDVFVPHIRNAFRTMALARILPDMSDQEAFPRSV